eukprot:Pompholyxophrys_punicea_v1_NODE_284_length_2390_cov_13.907066.p2 type:complete len:129 gc:universal NODE_284_length_2390_cov_13.907066:1592-1978(+)
MPCNFLKHVKLHNSTFSSTFDRSNLSLYNTTAPPFMIFTFCIASPNSIFLTTSFTSPSPFTPTLPPHILIFSLPSSCFLLAVFYFFPLCTSPSFPFLSSSCIIFILLSCSLGAPFLGLFVPPSSLVLP